MEEPLLVHPSSAPDTGSGLKVKRCSEITWVHLSRYYTHLLNLRHISSQPSTVQQFTLEETAYIHSLFKGMECGVYFVEILLVKLFWEG